MYDARDNTECESMIVGGDDLIQVGASAEELGMGRVERSGNEALLYRNSFNGSKMRASRGGL